MNIKLAERHQIENEMLFRRMNETVGDDLGALDAERIEKNEMYLVRDKHVLIKFKCECSDEDCTQRIPLRLTEYQEMHADRNRFIVKTDHQVDQIETVISSGSDYHVVSKNNSLPHLKDGKKMNKTTIDNSEKN